jgi:hypothetical protein
MPTIAGGDHASAFEPCKVRFLLHTGELTTEPSLRVAGCQSLFPTFVEKVTVFCTQPNRAMAMALSSIPRAIPVLVTQMLTTNLL